MVDKIDYSRIPVQKGEVLKLGVISVGDNGDMMFSKDNYCIFLKDVKDKPVTIGQMIDIKIVKVWQKCAYCTLC